MNSNQSHLMMAAGEIRQVIERLDAETSICEHCSRETWSNRTEYQAAVELKAIIAKLERWRAKLGDDR